MRDALIGFLAGIIATLAAVRMSWEDEDIRETEDESLDARMREWIAGGAKFMHPGMIACPYTTDQFYEDRLDEIAASEGLPVPYRIVDYAGDPNTSYLDSFTYPAGTDLRHPDTSWSSEPTPSEMLEPDTELCYGFSTTPKGSPCS